MISLPPVCLRGNALPLKLFRLLQLESEIQEEQRRHDTQSQRDSPGRAQMVVGADDDENVRDESANHEAPVNRHVGEEDEPAIASTTTQFSRSLRARNRSSRVFSSDSNPDQEAVRGQGSEHAGQRPPTVRTGTQGGEDDEDDGGNEQRVLSRPLITGISEDQLAQHGSGKGDGGDVLQRRGSRVGLSVQLRQDRGYGSNDLRGVSMLGRLAMPGPLIRY